MTEVGPSHGPARSGDEGVLAPYLSGALLDHLAQAVAVIGRDWRYRYVSPGVALLAGRPADELVGEKVWDVFPGAVGTPEHTLQVRSMQDRLPSRVTWFFPQLQAWWELRSVPTDDGLLVLADDVTERELSGTRSQRLVEVGEALAAATDAEQVNAVVVAQVLPLVRAAGGSLVLADPERGTMRPLGLVPGGAPADSQDYPITSRTPGTQAYRTGRAVFLSELPDAEPAYADAVPGMLSRGLASIAALPLPAEDRCLGVLVTVFREARLLGAGDRQFLTTAAAMAAQALVRAALLDVERRSVQGLQRSLLPQQLPVVPGLSVVARYAASDRAAQVGGDWYDVVLLPGGSVGLVLGDVEGHDLDAAALMGLVRGAVRAYALEGHPPAVLMARANAFLAGLRLGRIVTLAYSQVHPVELLITTVSAGHLPTLVVGTDGATIEVPAEVGPPLGVHEQGLHWPETTSTLPEHGLVAVFTDGLVEVRGEDLGEGLDRVRAVLEASRTGQPEQVAQALFDARGASHDDVALLVARLSRHADQTVTRRVTRRLPAAAPSAFLARHFTSQLLLAWGVATPVVEAAELVVSELVTNAARHSEDDVVLVLAHTARVLRIEVGDSSHRMPDPRVVGADATSGRGLQLVAAVSSRWGVVSEGLSKVVWAELDV